ncbi:hypothetical protein MBLNU230_g6314t1 [Neophaeotheca triangularis]
MVTNSTQPNPPEDTIPLERDAPIALILHTPKGRGVFATRPIPASTTIEISPVLVLDPEENERHIARTELYHYTYNWPLKCPDKKADGNAGAKAGVKTQAVVLGLGSMFNHSTLAQNVGWFRDVERGVVVYRTLKDVREGEELCISYGDNLTFEDADRKEIDESERESGEEVLGRIQLDT